MKAVSKQDVVWLAAKGAVAFACVLGVDALARIGTLELTRFDAGELFVAVVVIALLPTSYRVPVSGLTFGLAALLGVARIANVEAHAFLEGAATPTRGAAYVVQGAVYGTYIILFLCAKWIAERSSKSA
jgi:hypothetical protein